MKVGIDIGGSHIAIGVINNNDIIIEKIEKRLTAKEKANIEKFLENFIVDNVKELSQKYKVTEIGISAPGTIKEKKILHAGNLGVKNYKIVENLEKKINIPIKIRNDAKCAAIAECKIGALKGYKRSIFLTLGTGIGGAVIIDGKLLDTGDLPGCEFGHMIIEKGDIKRTCVKSGYFEYYASMKVFKDNLRNALELDKTTSGKELLDIIRKNTQNEKINKVIEEFIDYLSVGIASLVNIFEPEVIGIGGSFVYFSDVLLEKLKENIQNKKYLCNKRDELIILPAVLGNDAGIIGATL